MQGRASSSSENQQKNNSDREKLKLLPEMERIRLEELKWAKSRWPAMMKWAAANGIDLYQSIYSDAWPDDLKEWWLRVLSLLNIHQEICGLTALRDALEEEQDNWWNLFKLVREPNHESDSDHFHNRLLRDMLTKPHAHVH